MTTPVINAPVEALTLDPANLNRFRQRELDERGAFTGSFAKDALADGAVGVMQNIYDARFSLHRLEVALKEDPGLTPAERAVRLRQQAAKQRNGVASRIENWMPSAAKQLADLEASTAAPPAPKTPAEIAAAAELRAAIRSMRPEDRARLIDSRDDAIIGAVLGAHPMVSGMTPSQVEMVRISYRRIHHPGAQERISNWRAVIETVKKADTDFASQTRRMVEEKIALQTENARAAQAAALDVKTTPGAGAHG